MRHLVSFLGTVDPYDVVDSKRKCIRNRMAPCQPKFHNGRATQTKFSPRSPDLIPVDYFLWGYHKEKMYRGKPCTDVKLKQRNP